MSTFTFYFLYFLFLCYNHSNNNDKELISRLYHNYNKNSLWHTKSFSNYDISKIYEYIETHNFDLKLWQKVKIMCQYIHIFYLYKIMTVNFLLFSFILHLCHNHKVIIMRKKSNYVIKSWNYDFIFHNYDKNSLWH